MPKMEPGGDIDCLTAGQVILLTALGNLIAFTHIGTCISRVTCLT